MEKSNQKTGTVGFPSTTEPVFSFQEGDLFADILDPIEKPTPHAVPSVFQQTGWKRSCPSEVCMRPSVLQRISQFNFNITAPGFLNYFTSRTGVCFKDPLTVPFGQGPESHIVVHQRLCQKLQDCWEVFTESTHLAMVPGIRHEICAPGRPQRRVS